MSGNMSVADVVGIVRDAVASAAIVLGGLAAYFAISRQLKLASVGDVLKKEVEEKRELQNEIQVQITDISTAYSGTFPLMTVGNLQDLVAKAHAIERLSSQLRTEVANICLLLRLTMQNVSKYYSSQQNAKPSTAIATFYEKVLATVSVLNVKVTTFPSLLSLMRYSRRERFFAKALVKYGRDNKYRVLTFAEYGISLDPLRAEIIGYYETARQSGDSILLKSVIRVIRTVLPVTRSLFANGIYLPSVLDTSISFISSETLKMLLIGFRFMITVSDKEKQVIHAFYVPSTDFLQLQSTSIQDIRTDRDLYMDCDTDFVPMSVSLVESSIVKIEYDRESAECRFKNMKSALLKKFREEKAEHRPWKT